MRLRVQTFANNEVRISRQSDLARPPLHSDTSQQKYATKCAIASQQSIYLGKALDTLLNESGVYKQAAIPTAIQLDLFGNNKVLAKENIVTKVLPEKYKALTITPDGRYVVSLEPTEKLVKQRDRVLDIISDSQRGTLKHSDYGQTQSKKQFTKLARHRVLEAGAVVDRLGMKDSSSLLTLTLPGSTSEAQDALARWSGWIVNRQTQYLRRDRRFKDVYWFFVWEWQKRGALHQHWCVSAPTYELAREASMKLKSAWYLCLDEIGEKEGIDMYQKEGGFISWRLFPKQWVWNEQRVKKSVAAYFSKYASKAATDPKDKPDMYSKKLNYPSAWFGCSANIKKARKAYSLDFSLHYIHPFEAEILRHSLIAELYKFGVISSYAYQFEARSVKYQTVFCDGETEIYYISPAQFVGVVNSIRGQFQQGGNRVYKASPIQWELHRARQMRDSDSLPSSPFNPDYGKIKLFR